MGQKGVEIHLFTSSHNEFRVIGGNSLAINLVGAVYTALKEARPYYGHGRTHSEDTVRAARVARAALSPRTPRTPHARKVRSARSARARQLEPARRTATQNATTTDHLHCEQEDLRARRGARAKLIGPASL